MKNYKLRLQFGTLCTLKVESFAGIKFCGDKLSRTPRAKIKFRGYKLSRVVGKRDFAGINFRECQNLIKKEIAYWIFQADRQMRGNKRNGIAISQLVKLKPGINEQTNKQRNKQTNNLFTR